MRYLKTTILAAVLAFAANALLAQNTNSAFDEFNRNMAKMWNEQNKVTEQMWKEYYEFRDKCNQEYAKFLLQSWDTVSLSTHPTPSQPEQIKPSVYNGTMPEHVKKVNIPASSEETDFIAVFQEAKPFKALSEKVKEVKGKHAEKTPDEDIFQFQFYGTNLSVRMSNKMPKLKDCNAMAISGTWLALSKKSHDNMIVDCLAIKEERNLCDWAYLKMLQSLGAAYYSNSPNNATLLAAYIFVQSGYKIKLATCDNNLILLYASKFGIYGATCYVNKGIKYFVANYDDDADLKFLQICISKASMEHETPISMAISKEMKFDMNPSEDKELHANWYPEFKSNIKVNKNLIDFYNKYPASTLDGSSASKWITYANTPLSEEVKQTLYPSIREMVEGKDTSVALNIINNLIQSSFGIKTDNEVWGHDRTFFAEETLNYPNSDCEDKSILFARIVRDILGYEVVLLHYPGHLACGVKVKEHIYGTYYTLGNDSYLLCDPSYINTRIGTVLPEMRNQPVKIIKLDTPSNQ